MANSVFVPILKMPSGIGEVRQFISAAFIDFSISVPDVSFNNEATKDNDLTGDFIIVKGDAEEKQCWVSINLCSPELTGDEDCSILVDIKTRGSWVFAGIVAYAFCSYAGRTIFNDACELDGQESYSIYSLKEVLVKLLNESS